ncbi:hypothetical protein NPIL_153631 [Nephila pilipes]|uniref:Uncharacterized protein n=1 Tax=Nephila pilipes TaxID=299642 RepID=A0A8X6TFE6_NEPPI|nr:hypothetical protein NPIL_153631 [Nephila pilipes]
MRNECHQLAGDARHRHALPFPYTFVSHVSNVGGSSAYPVWVEYKGRQFQGRFSSIIFCSQTQWIAFHHAFVGPCGPSAFGQDDTWTNMVSRLVCFIMYQEPKTIAFVSFSSPPGSKAVMVQLRRSMRPRVNRFDPDAVSGENF